MKRSRCLNPKCPCVEHWQPSATVRQHMIGVPPLSVQRAADGFVVGRVTAEGTTEAYFLAYRPAVEGGLRLVAEPMPDAPPASWLPAIAEIQELLRGAEASTS